MSVENHIFQGPDAKVMSHSGHPDNPALHACVSQICQSNFSMPAMQAAGVDVQAGVPSLVADIAKALGF